MTRSEKIEEAARALVESDPSHEEYQVLRVDEELFDALRAALSQPVEPVASECSMCGVLEARIEELKDEVTRMQARVEGAWQAGHDAHVRIEQATIEALRDRVHWLEGHALALPEEPSASGGDEARTACGCGHLHWADQDGEDAGCQECECSQWR